MLKNWKKYMSDWGWIIFLVGWFVVMKFVLPRFGIGT
jgi:p-aminobenzoyl-glutamate transporter AbgT